MGALYTRFWAGLVVSGAFLAGGTPLRAQSTAPGTPCPPVRDTQGNLIPNTGCVTGTPAAPAADRFPYPGETQPAIQTPNSPTAPTAPQVAAPQPQSNDAPGAPAGKRFPYPGETDAPSTPQTPTAPSGASSPPKGSPLQDAGSSGDSTSSSAGTSSSSSSSAGAGQDDEAGKGSSAADPDANDPAAVPRSKRHKLPPVPRQSPSEREQEDVQVAGFYFNNGNFRGSYERARDAVSLDGDDAAAHLALGDAARKLGKLDEAEKAYRRCLELDPVPKVKKSAEKSLREMTGG